MTTSFDQKTHTYLIGGKRATGVTTIIGVLAKPQLIGWAARMAVEYIKENGQPVLKKSKLEEVPPVEEICEYLVSVECLAEAQKAHTKKKEAAGEHGTDTHALVEDYVNYCIKSFDGQPVNDYALDSDDPILKFKAWAVENVDHFLFSERQMFNKELFVAGTADFGAVMKDGKKLIGDFKTSSGVYGIDYFLQCAGYKILAEAEGDTSYDGCVIARLGKDGEFEATYRYDTKTDEEAFRACLTLYRAQATYTKPIK